MKINGRTIASEILDKLKPEVEKLKRNGTTPTLAIILVGDDEASNIYVRQKGIKAREIGAQTKLFHFKENTTNEKIENLIKKLEKNPKIHGIILQRPAPENIEVERLSMLVSPEKEVDGFGTLGTFSVPVAQAVIVILKFVYKQIKTQKDFESWLKSKNLVVIGKGQTGGRPVIDLLRKKGLRPKIIDSQTSHKDKLTRNADIIVSAVGKKVLDSAQIKMGAILISVGLYKDKQGKLRGDYDDSNMAEVAGYYTPTPGGVGPVNVACLMQNLVKAAEISAKKAL